MSFQVRLSIPFYRPMSVDIMLLNHTGEDWQPRNRLHSIDNKLKIAVESLQAPALEITICLLEIGPAGAPTSLDIGRGCRGLMLYRKHRQFVLPNAAVLSPFPRSPGFVLGHDIQSSLEGDSWRGGTARKTPLQSLHRQVSTPALIG